MDEKVEEYKYDRFGWIMGPEENWIGLREPSKEYAWPGHPDGVSKDLAAAREARGTFARKRKKSYIHSIN